MAQVYEGIEPQLREFVEEQPVFFVATAPSSGGHVNLSPKGGRGCLAVLDPHRVAYLDYAGSGAETIAHVRDNGRIVLMFCAFSGPPKIVRLHGTGRSVGPGDPGFQDLLGAFPITPAPGLRSIIDVAVTRVSDSCGFAVPLMAYAGDRTLLAEFFGRKTSEEFAQYLASRNATSIDGLPALVPERRPAPRTIIEPGHAPEPVDGR
jgi:hypothetical protein